MRRWAIINVLLGLMVALLGLQIVGTWARSLPQPEERTRSAAPAPDTPARDKARRGGDKGAARTAGGPEALVAAVAEKELFDPSRRPPADEGSAAPLEAAPLPPPTGVSVVGIRFLRGEREAFIQDATQANKQRRIRIGDQVQSYTVKEIEDGKVILASPTGQTMIMEVELKKSGGARGPAPAIPGRSPAAGAMTATTVTVPRPTTTTTTRPPGPRAGGAELPTLNRSVKEKLDKLRGSDAGRALGRVGMPVSPPDRRTT